MFVFEIAHMAKPNRQRLALPALLCACGLLMRPTVFAAKSSGTKRVVYVGAESAETDTRYHQFSQAMKSLLTKTELAVQINYVKVPVMAPEAKRRELMPLLAARPDVLVAPTAATALAAIQQPRSSSIVFASAPDPVRAGIVKSLRQPGPQITGVSLADDWHAKRIELLRDAFPRGHKLGVMLDRAWAKNEDFKMLIEEPAKSFGYVANAFLSDTAEEAVRVLQSTEGRRMSAWYVPRNLISFVAEKQIIEQLRRMQVPAIHATEQEVANGALMAFAQDIPAANEMLADLTLRVLRGEDAGSIPIQRPKKFILAVRPRDEAGTPQINPSVIRRADRVY
jgi:putative tryptophan/tyrosine transport system substrate-binding protein